MLNNQIDIKYLKERTPEGNTILGNCYWCDWKVENGELYVKSDMCIEPGWFATGDMVYLDNEERMYYEDRKLYK